MRLFLLAALIGTPILAESALAASVDLPYTGGKKVFEFSLSDTTDSVRVGNRFTFRMASWKGILPTVCGYQTPIGIRVLGARMMGRKNMDSTWMAYPAYPSAQDSLVSLDTIGGQMSSTSPSSSQMGGSPGFWYAESGTYHDCTGRTWGFVEGAHRVAFVEGGGAYAKLKLIAYRESVDNPTPMLRYATLTRVTFRLIVNTSTGDLVDPNPPAALARAVRTPGAPRGKGAVAGFYDVRGIRWNASSARVMPLLPWR